MLRSAALLKRTAQARGAHLDESIAISLPTAREEGKHGRVAITMKNRPRSCCRVERALWRTLPRAQSRRGLN